jgi:DNA primase
LLQSLPKPGPKFSGPRGGKSTLFGSDLWTGHQTLILTEGEWDCMLCWQLANDLADFATLGGASHRANYIDLTSLARFQKILAVYDSDEAGDQARKYLSSIPRIRTVTPPAHDLTDYFRLGGDLRTWIASILPRIQ